MISLLHAAIVPHPTDPYRAIFCEFGFSGYQHYTFLSRTLAGELVYAEAGTFSDCRAAWKAVTGCGLPWDIQSRSV